MRPSLFFFRTPLFVIRTFGTDPPYLFSVLYIFFQYLLRPQSEQQSETQAGSPKSCLVCEGFRHRRVVGQVTVMDDGGIEPSPCIDDLRGGGTLMH